MHTVLTTKYCVIPEGRKSTQILCQAEGFYHDIYLLLISQIIQLMIGQAIIKIFFTSFQILMLIFASGQNTLSDQTKTLEGISPDFNATQRRLIVLSLIQMSSKNGVRKNTNRSELKVVHFTQFERISVIFRSLRFIVQWSVLVKLFTLILKGVQASTVWATSRWNEGQVGIFLWYSNSFVKFEQILYLVLFIDFQVFQIFGILRDKLQFSSRSSKDRNCLFHF